MWITLYYMFQHVYICNNAVFDETWFHPKFSMFGLSDFRMSFKGTPLVGFPCSDCSQERLPGMGDERDEPHGRGAIGAIGWGYLERHPRIPTDR